MLSTKCEKCLFANQHNTTGISECSQNIIEKIKDIKKITQENNFNVIHEYACRYGFAKEVYEANKEDLKEVDLLQQIKTNSQTKYYLLLDISPGCSDINHIINSLNDLEIKPQFISLMFRDPKSRIFTQEDKELLTSKINTPWKSHNFTHEINLQDAIDHILSTNMQISKSSYFLVYNSLDLENLSLDIHNINDTIVLYQKPHIAMIKNFISLNGLFMSFENYKVAKSLGDDILSIIKNETQSEIIQF
jgi:hypothetical protein